MPIPRLVAIPILLAACASLTTGSAGVSSLEVRFAGETAAHRSGCIAFTRKGDVVHLWALTPDIPALNGFEIGVTLPPPGQSEAPLGPALALSVPGPPRPIGYAFTGRRDILLHSESGRVVFSQIHPERLSGSFWISFVEDSPEPPRTEVHLHVHGSFSAPRNRALERYVYRSAADSHAESPSNPVCAVGPATRSAN